jgi:hypothetical protein
MTLGGRVPSRMRCDGPCPRGDIDVVQGACARAGAPPRRRRLFSTPASQAGLVTAGVLGARNSRSAALPQLRDDTCVDIARSTLVGVTRNCPCGAWHRRRKFRREFTRWDQHRRLRCSDNWPTVELLVAESDGIRDAGSSSRSPSIEHDLGGRMPFCPVSPSSTRVLSVPERGCAAPESAAARHSAWRSPGSAGGPTARRQRMPYACFAELRPRPRKSSNELTGGSARVGRARAY